MALIIHGALLCLLHVTVRHPDCVCWSVEGFAVLTGYGRVYVRFVSVNLIAPLRSLTEIRVRPRWVGILSERVRVTLLDVLQSVERGNWF